MARRFRKSVKISKGIRVNFSKSGASLSLGGRGNGVNIGSRGTTVRHSIPGLGLSYSKRVSGSGHHGSRRKSTKRVSTKVSIQKPRSSSSVYVPKTFRLEMDESGKILVFGIWGNEITDPAVIRKLKTTSNYKHQKEQLEIERKARIDSIVKDAEEENERFINIYKQSCVVEDLESFTQQLNNLKLQEFVEEPYDIPCPTEQEIRKDLEDEAKQTVQGSIFTVGKLRKQYVEEHFQERYDEAVDTWEQDKAEYYEDQEEEKEEMESLFHELYEEQKAFLSSLISGDPDTVAEVFDDWIASCELPVEIAINYDWSRTNRTMFLDADLPEIEDLNPTKMIKTDSGNLKEKKKTQSELRGEYATLVFGLAIFISSHTFNISPAIQRILISGYTQRKNKDGDLKDTYIYSLRFYRDQFENKDLSDISPRNTTKSTIYLTLLLCGRRSTMISFIMV